MCGLTGKKKKSIKTLTLRGSLSDFTRSIVNGRTVGEVNAALTSITGRSFGIKGGSGGSRAVVAQVRNNLRSSGITIRENAGPISSGGRTISGQEYTTSS